MGPPRDRHWLISLLKSKLYDTNLFDLSLSAKVGDLVSSTYKIIKTKLPATLRSMSLYLSNRDTEFILFKPVRVSVLVSLFFLSYINFLL